MHSHKRKHAVNGHTIFVYTNFDIVYNFCMPNNPTITYISLLRDEYLNRKAVNPLYSIRSFAKHIGLTPAYVSMIFQKKRFLSQATALKVAKKLNWNKSKQKYFVNLLEFENPKSEENKEIALLNLHALERSDVNFNSLEIDTFEAISVWYYNAIITLLTILKNKATVVEISKRLNLNSIEVESAMQRLKRLGIVEQKNKCWVAVHEYLRVESTPSDAIRLFHKQHLVKADNAITTQGFEERDFSNMTIAVDCNKLQIAKNKIVEFHHEMAKLLDGNNPTEVYQLSVQLFRLTNPEGK
jgi:uncharacterized protein (TIGR02147 family)